MADISTLRKALAGPLSPFTAYRQFLLYKLVPNAKGKMDKIPIGSSTDASTWCDWETACDRAESLRDMGVGFVFTANDPFWFIDIDGGWNGVEWSEVTRDISEGLAGCAIEVSQSNKGLHIFGTGAPPAEYSNKNTALGIEFYTRERFVALTGTNAAGSAAHDGGDALRNLVTRYFPPRAASAAAPVIGNGPVPEWIGPTDDAELLALMRRSKATPGFGGAAPAHVSHFLDRDVAALAARYPSPSGQEYDASSADMAFCCSLAFYTGKDAARMLRIVQASPMMREKWNRPDYRDATISGAIGLTSAVYGARTVPTVQGSGDRALDGDKYAALNEHTAALGASGTLQELDQAAERAKQDPRLTDDMRETLAHTYQRHAHMALAGAKLPIGLCRIKFVAPRPVLEVDDGFDRDGDGAIVRSQKNLNTAMRKLGFRYDAFTGRVLLGEKLLTDNTYVEALVMAEVMGCQSPTIQQIRMAVHFVAGENEFDSAQDWLASLPAWDGVQRIETCLPRVLNLPDSFYLRTVSRYLWTALAGRVIEPGAKADSIPVFISEEEGFNKTTLVEAFAPDSQFFGELDMTEKSDDIKRKMRGKLVMEWNELAGLKNRDREHTLAFITRREEEFTDKWQVTPTRFKRRLMILGTSNDTRFLNAHAKERRMLPIELLGGPANVALLVSEREQLWAEAAVTFRANGVEWRNLETSAPEVRELFREEDPTEIFVQRFLDSARPAKFGETSGKLWKDDNFRIADVKAYLEDHKLARRMPSDVTISKLLKKLGYKNRKLENFNVWKLGGCEQPPVL